MKAACTVKCSAKLNEWYARDCSRKRRSSLQTKGSESEFVKMMLENSSCRQGETAKANTRKIAKNEKRIAELDKMFSSLYEDKENGIITVERFKQISAGFEREQAALTAENETLQAEADAFKEDSQKTDRFISLLWKYGCFEELTATILNEFIVKVVVHESVWSEANETNWRMGTRTQGVDIPEIYRQ